MNRALIPIVFFLLLAPAAWAAESSTEVQPPASASSTDAIPDFSLLDEQGRHHELRRLDGKAVVLFIGGNGCPIVRQSINKLRALRGKYAKAGVTFWMLNANSQDDRESVLEEAQSFNYGSTPVLLDEHQFVARILGVTRTAEAIVISTKDWRIVYRGAIDDQLSEGAIKPSSSTNYLETALTQFLAGETVTNAKTPVKGCLVRFDRPAPRVEEPVSYTKVIAPLLQKKCVECHSPGNIGPFALSSHRKVKGWSEMIREVILAKRMPPWHADPHFGKFSNDRSLTPDETSTIFRWIDQGCPKDDGEDPLLTLGPKAKGWALGEPDLVVTLPKTESIPANGVLLYRYVDSPIEIPQDSWLRACVIRPDNRKVVHHVIVRVKYPDGAKGRPAEDFFLAGWAPGYRNAEYPAGTGKFLPKGARFNFELHYTTTGKEEVDQSDVGLYFAATPPSMVLETRTAENREIDIPPGESDSRNHSLYGFQRDTILYELIPHMHLRGSWFKYEALYPTGRRETLLSVPNYDFNWQTEYRLTEPKLIPAGTWLFCTGGFDNSARNPHNPDPTKRVKHGLQSFDEMFSGFMTVADVPSTNGNRQARQ